VSGPVCGIAGAIIGRRDNAAVRWDVFCKVVDNFGDIGVCWRLACNLAAQGERVRLRVDDASALAWMAPRGAPGVTVSSAAEAAFDGADVVVETFGCGLPAQVLAGMAAAATAPCWVNLEYLSAEPYVLRSHGLPSPQWSGPAAGLVSHFFYPGFSAGTGGLLREPGLLERRARFDRRAWLAARGWHLAPGQRVVVLFGYRQPALPALLHLLAAVPTLLLVAPGPLQADAMRLGQGARRRAGLDVVALPYLPQAEFDHLLWSADFAFVRGEDSVVRAIWAGVPFVWQLYAQDDGAHHAKLEAFLQQMLAGVPGELAGQVADVFRAWNAGRPDALDALQWPPMPAWRRLARQARDRLATQTDLATQLRRFVMAKR
jgi:uncharacterized repeat protein (TIGR03837 family)